MDERDEAVALELGRRIRQRRQAAGLGQATLARKAKLHPGTISELERGKREVQASTIVLICGGLNVRPGDLLDGIEWVLDPESPGQGGWRITSRAGEVPGDRGALADGETQR